VVGDFRLYRARGDIGPEDSQREERKENDRDEIKEKLDPYASVLQGNPQSERGSW
jgi:hypothetical protein